MHQIHRRFNQTFTHTLVQELRTLLFCLSHCLFVCKKTEKGEKCFNNFRVWGEFFRLLDALDQQPKTHKYLAYNDIKQSRGQKKTLNQFLFMNLLNHFLVSASHVSFCSFSVWKISWSVFRFYTVFDQNKKYEGVALDSGKLTCFQYFLTFWINDE